MNIFDFKNISSFKKAKKAFTLVEILLVVSLIGFLYIVTTKVIHHNIDHKIPLYVYNLYKNLNNESILLTRKLLEEANGESSSSGSDTDNGGSSVDGNTGEESNGADNTSKKTIEEVLSGLDAKSYCEAFAEDINTLGNIDCQNIVKIQPVIEDLTKNITYDCTRSYKFSVNDNGTYEEIREPILENSINTCESNNDVNIEALKCKATPTISINNLLINNTNNLYAYNCKINKSDDNENENKHFFDIRVKPNFTKSLKTINNINLNFIDIVPETEKYILKYNLLANINQDAICPEISRAKFDKSSSVKCNITFSKVNLVGDLYDPLNSTILYKREPYEFYCKRMSGGLKKSSNEPVKSHAYYGLDQSIPTMNNNCIGYIQHADDIKKFKQIDFINYKDKIVWYPGVDGSYCSTPTNQKTREYCAIDPPESTDVGFLYINVKLLNRNTILDNDSQNFNHELYYNKWSNFFNNNRNFAKVTKSELNLTSKNEGSVERTIEKKTSEKLYLARFIYAAIDTTLEKGEMNKNIFVFEQFGDKIIPVGFLANDPNTPLKFDVITRNPTTYKIEKINYKDGMEKRPLTFCEAMAYTGEKFSEYCGCKKQNEPVTQYDKSSYCFNSFGCMISPVKPSTIGRFK